LHSQGKTGAYLEVLVGRFPIAGTLRKKKIETFGCESIKKTKERKIRARHHVLAGKGERKPVKRDMRWEFKTQRKGGSLGPGAE